MTIAKLTNHASVNLIETTLRHPLDWEQDLRCRKAYLVRWQDLSYTVRELCGDDEVCMQMWAATGPAAPAPAGIMRHFICTRDVLLVIKTYKCF